MIMCVCYHHCIILTKSSQCTFSQHLPLQSMNTNTKVACERCSKLIKKTLVRPKSTAAIHFTPCLSAFMVVFEMQVDVQCGIGSISMLTYTHIHNAANQAIARSSWQSYFKKSEVFFSRNNRVQ